MDTVVDEYFAVQDTFDDLIESVEETLLSDSVIRNLGNHPEN